MKTVVKNILVLLLSCSILVISSCSVSTNGNTSGPLIDEPPEDEPIDDEPPIDNPPIVETPISVEGNFDYINETFISNKDNSFAYVTNRTFTNGSIDFRIVSSQESNAGLIFAMNEDFSSYYYCGVNNLEFKQFVLYKHVDNEDIPLKACYMSQHKHEYVYSIRIEFFEKDIKCFFEGQLYNYYIDNDYLTGDRIGFMSNLSGNEFSDIAFSNESIFEEHDVLLTGHSYFHLWDNYKEDLNKYEDVFNIAIGGTTTSDWALRSDEIVAYNPNKVVICIGVNDFFGSMPGSIPFGYVKTLLDLLLERLPGTDICALSINQSLTHNIYLSQIRVYNSLLKEYMDTNERLHYGDMDNAFLDSSGNPNPSCFTDGLHPTKESYKVFVDAIYKAFGTI